MYTTPIPTDTVSPDNSGHTHDFYHTAVMTPCCRLTVFLKAMITHLGDLVGYLSPFMNFSGGIRYLS
ncbi:MAG: hypothetical protein WCF90_08135 [Methanomicrobiales archaeon]